MEGVTLRRCGAVRAAKPGGASPGIAAVGVALAFACAPGAPSSPGETTGTVAVRVSTTGQNMPGGYDVSIDEQGVGSVPANGESEFDGVAPGSRSVGLGALPANCAVDGDNPRRATVAESSTTEVAFGVVCGPLPTGTVEVSTTTSGEDLDPDGYALTIDLVDRGAIGVDDTRAFAGVPVGNRDVELTGLADNCAVQGANPRAVPVSEGQTAPTTFAVVCLVTTGSIRVSVSTSGFLEDDFYTVTLDDTASQDVAQDGSVTFDEVSPGSHEIRLDDVSTNCDVETDNPVAAEVSAGATTDVSFEVSCGIF